MMLLRWVLHKIVTKLSGEASGGLFPRLLRTLDRGSGEVLLSPTICWLNAEELGLGVSTLSHRTEAEPRSCTMAEAMLPALQEML